jgi:hypothetical protein
MLQASPYGNFFLEMLWEKRLNWGIEGLDGAGDLHRAPLSHSLTLSVTEVQLSRCPAIHLKEDNDERERGKEMHDA